MPKVSIIDYGMGNILSVKRGFEHCGAEVVYVTDPNKIKNADYLILPGVGAFRDAMNELNKLELVDAILKFAKKGNPFLGICLGMQMMMNASEEFGYSMGLGLIPGNVVKIENTTTEGEFQKVPHVGWNEICIPERQDMTVWDNTIINGIREHETMYFVHSYTAKPQEAFRLADSYYGGRRIAAVVKNDHLYGCQFHPEKSGIAGLKIIKNFLEI